MSGEHFNVGESVFLTNAACEAVNVPRGSTAGILDAQPWKGHYWVRISTGKLGCFHYRDMSRERQHPPQAAEKAQAYPTQEQKDRMFIYLAWIRYKTADEPQKLYSELIEWHLRETAALRSQLAGAQAVNEKLVEALEAAKPWLQLAMIDRIHDKCADPQALPHSIRLATQALEAAKEAK